MHNIAYTHIASRLFNTPLALAESKAGIIANAIGSRVFGANLSLLSQESIQATVLADTLSDNYCDIEQVSIARGVGVIRIEGSLIHKGGFIGASSGQTSYQGLSSQVAAASRLFDGGEIKALVLELDSFGGEVAGIRDIAAQIYSLSKKLPTISIINDNACSAAYWLASQANSIVASPTSIVGSIGVVSIHVNMAAALAGEGLDVKIITSGKHKADGNSYEALSKEVESEMRSDFDSIREMFAEDVARGRRKKVTKATALATEAKTYTGQKAFEVGLVDAIENPSVAFEAFVKKYGR